MWFYSWLGDFGGLGLQLSSDNCHNCCHACTTWQGAWLAGSDYGCAVCTEPSIKKHRKCTPTSSLHHMACACVHYRQPAASLAGSLLSRRPPPALNAVVSWRSRCWSSSAVHLRYATATAYHSMVSLAIGTGCHVWFMCCSFVRWVSTWYR
jgi:hypothetical protein